MASLPLESPTRRIVPSSLNEREVMWNVEEEVDVVEEEDDKETAASRIEVESRSILVSSLTRSSRSLERAGDEIDKMTGEGVINLITISPIALVISEDEGSRPSSRCRRSLVKLRGRFRCTRDEAPGRGRKGGGGGGGRIR